MTEDTSKTAAGNEPPVMTGDRSAAEPDGENGAREKHRENVRNKEIGGRGGLDPTRYGDWEKDGRCIDF